MKSDLYTFYKEEGLVTSGKKVMCFRERRKKYVYKKYNKGEKKIKIW